jgi:hypothetical protein
MNSGMSDDLAFIAKHVYALARTGVFEDSAAIQQELAAEGFTEHTRWLQWPGVRDALDAICAVHRWRE